LAAFASQVGGVCSDLGYCTIESVDECGPAAAALSFEDTEVSGDPINRVDRVPGCFLTAEGSLKFNLALESTTSASSSQTILCALCDDAGGGSDGGGNGRMLGLRAQGMPSHSVVGAVDVVVAAVVVVVVVVLALVLVAVLAARRARAAPRAASPADHAFRVEAADGVVLQMCTHARS
jgi:hypothetical protein